jgi:hypothetical protein
MVASVPYIFTNYTEIIDADEVNADFAAVVTAINTAVPPNGPAGAILVSNSSSAGDYGWNTHTPIVPAIQVTGAATVGSVSASGNISGGSLTSIAGATIGGYGVTYSGYGGHAIGIGWDGTNLQSYVDNTYEGALVTSNYIGNVSISGTATVGSLNCTGNAVGGQVASSSGNFYVPGPGAAIFSSTGAANQLATLYLYANAVNIQGNGNLATGGTVTAQQLTSTGNINASGSIGVSVNVTAGNLYAGNLVQGAQITSTGNINASATVTGANVTATGTVTGAQVTSTGNINASANIGAVGTIQGNYLVSAGNLYAPGTATLNQVNASGLTVSGGVTFNGGFNSTTNAVVGNTGIRYSNFDGSNSIGFAWNVSAGGLNVYVNNVYEGSAISDRRRKRNLGRAVRDALKALSEVELYAFDKVDGQGQAMGHHDVGFVADQLQQVIPEAVIPGPKPDDVLSLDLMPLVGYCVRAIQQLAQRVEALEARA